MPRGFESLWVSEVGDFGLIRESNHQAFGAPKPLNQKLPKP